MHRAPFDCADKTLMFAVIPIGMESNSGQIVDVFGYLRVRPRHVAA